MNRGICVICFFKISMKQKRSVYIWRVLLLIESIFNFFD